MISKIMYDIIRNFKKKGFSKTEIKNETGNSSETIAKYYDMSEKEFIKYVDSLRNRPKSFEQFKDFIFDIYILNDMKNLSKASIYDCLLEEFGSLPGTERTFRNYVNFLIKNKEIDIKKRKRSYIPVEELEYGKQMQIDFGEFKCSNGKKFFIFAAILSASRYKYCACQTTPFTSLDLVNHLINCFEYYEGIPEEIVIDQDCIMVANQNYGDIIYTHHFNNFKEEMGFKVFVCKKNDPETKGKIEALVKYIKNNYFAPRQYKLEDPDEVKLGLLKWLRRRANGKISYAIRKIPQLVFDNEEKQCLKPLKKSIYMKDDLNKQESRKVNSFSEITVESCHYPVPEKYIGEKVNIFLTDGFVIIFDQDSNLEIAKLKKLIIPGSRHRDIERIKRRNIKPLELKEEILQWFELEIWKIFVEKNYKKFVRFFRDQVTIAQKTLKNEKDIVLLKTGIEYCLENDTLSFKNLSDTCNYFRTMKMQDTKIQEKENCEKNTINQQYQILDMNYRDISYYEKIIKNSTNEVKS